MFPRRRRRVSMIRASILTMLLVVRGAEAFGKPSSRRAPTIVPISTRTRMYTTTGKSDQEEATSVGVEETNEAAWGATVSLADKPKAATASSSAVTSPGTSTEELIENQFQRNLLVAVVSILLSIGNYVYQISHPVTAVQLLTEMQQSSAPVTVIGTNGKPSVVDFWAPWCENCKLAAPTLHKVEQEYQDKVNFVMVNGDDFKNTWPYLEAFGVDAIPHLALVSASGDIETALIGPTPKSVMEADLNVLIDNATKKKDKQQPLPYVMLDVFANTPEKRHVHFDK